MTEGRLSGKVAIVTGASRGIGRATVLRFSREGALVGAVARSEDALAELADEVNQEGRGRCIPIRGDVTSERDIEAAVAETTGKLGPVDILVNNAGAFIHKPFLETKSEDFIRLFTTNALSAFLFSRAVAPAMIGRGQGKIINIASSAARKGYKEQTAYCASKHAMLGLSKALALELHGTGVSVHVINPGGVNTDLVRRARTDVNFDEYMAPEEVADIVLFVAAMDGMAVLDELVVRRSLAQPWSY